jgi:hypothetical protein
LPLINTPTALSLKRAAQLSIPFLAAAAAAATTTTIAPKH